MNNKYIKFKKRATITTNNDEKYLLEKNRFFIMPHRGIKKYKHKYGNACTITKLDPITGEFNSNFRLGSESFKNSDRFSACMAD